MDKIGPCPLCGGGAYTSNNHDHVLCEDTQCPMPPVDYEVWVSLSTLAAENKRMREALERCREFFMQASRGSEGDEQEAFEAMAHECEKALKGGKE